MSVKLNVKMEMPGKEPKEFNYEFDQTSISLGRDSNNDIQIPLTTVSRNHAKLEMDGHDWFLEDLKSTHGTVHNGKPVGSGGKKLLRNGDTIELMHFKIHFESHADKPMELGGSERTEMLARRMVQEVLSSIGGGTEAPYLRVMNGPDEGKRFEMGDGIGEVVIGRATDCDFPINDANISRRHALVRKDWSGITIEDLGSKNGVCINDKKIEKTAPLKDSDEINLGAVKLAFIDPTASMLGKLDDLAVFKKDAPEEEEAPAEEQEEASTAQAGGDGGGSSSEASGSGSMNTLGKDGDGDASGEKPAKDGDEDASQDGEDTGTRTKGMGDYLVYAAVGLVVLGLVAAGIVVVVMQ